MDRDITPQEMVRQGICNALELREPAERAAAITAVLRTIRVYSADLREVRGDDIREMRRTMTQQQVGTLVGLTPGRVAQIENHGR